MISPLAHVAPGAKIGENVEIHPFAYIEEDVVIGDNCTIMPYVSILNGTRMGKSNKIYSHAVLAAEPQDFRYTGDTSELIIGDQNAIRENVVIARSSHRGSATQIGNNNFFMDGAHICHDVKIGNKSVVGISSIVTGDCVIEDCTILSSLVTLQQNCHIGSWVLIQSGCRIGQDIPPYAVMNGNPAAFHGVNTVILAHHNFTDRVIRHIAAAYRLVYHANFSLQDAVLKIKDQIPMSDEIRHIISFLENSKRGIVR